MCLKSHFLRLYAEERSQSMFLSQKTVQHVVEGVQNPEQRVRDVRSAVEPGTFHLVRVALP